jgi:hypothetical protein
MFVPRILGKSGLLGGLFGANTPLGPILSTKIRGKISK